MSSRPSSRTDLTPSHRRPPGRPRGSRSLSGQRLEALDEPASVALLSPSKRLEPLRDVLEPLFPSSLGKAGVHLGVLVGLACDSRSEILLGRTDRLPRHRIADLFQEVEMTEGVTRLALCDGAEQRGDVRVSLDVGRLRKVDVAPV